MTEMLDVLRLQLAIEASGEIVFATDSDGVFTYVNPEFERAYGYRASELIGRVTPRVLKSGTTPAGDYADFWALLKQKQIVRREFHNRAKDGSVLFIETSANPIIDPETRAVLGYLAVQRDVTDRKHLERDLLQAQKMEALGQLAGGVAHDFNNLLTAILGYSELLKDELGDQAAALQDLAEVVSAAQRASRLARQLLAFSRKKDLQREPLDLSGIVTDFHPMLASIVCESIEVSVRTEADAWPVMADRSQVEQVILNLVVNSRDAMPKGGQLTIATANVELDAAFVKLHSGLVPGAFVALSVRDTGSGMDEATAKRAFEPFFTTKAAGHGTGLGLATVHGIVKEHGGCVTIDSRAGEGTTVTAYFPRTGAVNVQSPPARDEQNSAHGGETVLVVEDETGVRSLMRTALERQGYVVLEANDASDALRIATTHQGPIDLLLSDVVMPGLNGPDLAQRIVRVRPTIRILYVSGFPNRLLSRQPIARTRMAFLAKPFTPQVLARSVRETLAV